MAQAVGAQPLGQAELWQVEAGFVGIGGNEQGVVLFAEKAGELSRGGGAVRNHMGIRDIRRHGRVLMVEQAAGDRSITRKEVDGLTQPLVIAGRCFAGERVIPCGIVICHGVVHAAHQRHLVHDGGRVGQALADLNVRAGRPHRPVGAPHPVVR